MQRLLVALGAIFLADGAAVADSSVTTQRSVTKVADGVYSIRHVDAPDTNPQGNTTVIIGERAVLVVDSSYLPSSAAEDIAQIRRWTDRPVRYVLNTHWHPDHQRGNSVYVDAFPDVSIVAHVETARLMASYDAANRERYPKRLQAMQATLAQKPDAELQKTVDGRNRVLAELERSRLQLPTLTFDSELNLDLGNRVVEIRHSGTGDTRGDAWAWLPQEQVLVTGDVLAAPVPYFFAGYPEGLAHTLHRLLELDAKAIVPGHGDVMRDKTYMRAVLEMVETIVGQVNAAVVRIGSLSARLEDVRPQIDVAEYRQRFAGDDPHNQEYFDESIEGLIKDAFYQAPK
ncbi:MAG TPA: MBL fold metallo-hydrolase [Steroidobacteraceae bacterium]|jgi:glyoxylase-like metal-dependent hydrolase (beta-lactamase superfamily II)|nr:MBL fold metallo-hydrolase [Steroidobacteraceae bacterium]